VHYEVSNFSKPGRESVHNRAYWTGEAYVGLGPGAHSYLPPRRYWNVRDWNAYVAMLGRGELPVAGEERVTGSAAALERIWLGLRTAEGIEGMAWSAGQERLLRRWRSEGWVREDADAVRLTPRGWLLLDRLAVELEGAA